MHQRFSSFDQAALLDISFSNKRKIQLRQLNIQKQYLGRNLINDITKGEQYKASEERNRVLRMCTRTVVYFELQTLPDFTKRPL